MSFSELALRELVAHPSVDIIPVIAHPCVGEFQGQSNHIRYTTALAVRVGSCDCLRLPARQRTTIRVVPGPLITLLCKPHQLTVVGRPAHTQACSATRRYESENG